MNAPEEDQIARADRIHADIRAKIPDHLQSESRIILKKPAEIPEPKKAARDLVEWGFPCCKPRSEFESFMQSFKQNEEWVFSPHHESLMALVASRKLPDDRGQDITSRPRTLDQARRRSTFHGNQFPRKFYDGSSPSEGESEAFYAARMIFHSGIIDRINLQLYGTHLSVRSLVSNFPVPHPRRPNGVPYLLDQLWVILQRGPSVRLLALEVDGHSTSNQTSTGATQSVMKS